MSTVIITPEKMITKEIFLILPSEIIHQMVQNQVHISFKDSTTDPLTLSNMKVWCNLNCSGLVRKDGPDFYFELEEDMTGFKIAFEGMEIE